jgi:type IV secretion system T-DNA border endonuclease VirD2
VTAGSGQPAHGSDKPERQLPQVIVRLVPRGGARTATQIRDQWRYLSRKGEVQLQHSERHFGIFMPVERIGQMAISWVKQTGERADSIEAGGGPELTTHIVVSFPVGTDPEKAFSAGRAWAEEMFGSGTNGGTFDYLTACHSDRPHPHVHLVVNRRAIEGHWLKISRRHPSLNYQKMRATLAEIARRYGIEIEATSRIDRGITERPVTYAEYRRRARGKARGAASPDTL